MRLSTYTLQSPTEARDQGEGVATHLGSTLLTCRDRVFEDRVAGVFMCGMLTYWSREPSAYGYIWIWHSVPNPGVANAEAILGGIDKLLFDRVSLQPSEGAKSPRA